MVIKVAVDRDQNGNIQWQTMYAAAIQNRLRADNNLSDLTDKAAARRNLGITGTGSSGSTDSDQIIATANSYTDAQISSLQTTVSQNQTDITKIKAAIVALGGRLS